MSAESGVRSRESVKQIGHGHGLGHGHDRLLISDPRLPTLDPRIPTCESWSPAARATSAATVKQLLARGHEVTVFDNLSAGHRAAVPADRLVVGDLRDIDHVDHLLVVNRVEAVVHFAAHCYVGESVKEPAKYYTNNLVYTLNLIERCRRNGTQKFVFSSTCAT